MTLDALIIIAGVLVAMLPFLGFPIQWDNMILVALGVGVITLGIILRRRIARRTSQAHRTFAESARRTELHDAQ